MSLSQIPPAKPGVYPDAINVRALIQFDNVTVAAGSPIGMGRPRIWKVTLTDPQGFYTTVESFETTAGDELVFGVNGNGITPDVVQSRLNSVNPDSAAENLHQVALHYWMECDLFNNLAAKAQRVHNQRLPSVGLFFSPLCASYFFGIPRWGNYRAREMDIKRSMLAAVADNETARLAFMNQSGVQESYLEGSVFDQLFLRPQGKSISAVQILMDANQQGIPIHRITQANLGQVLPQLAVSEEAKSNIVNAVQAGNTAITPQGEITHGTWKGVGYVLQDSQTGAGAYLIDGGLHGGAEGECVSLLTPEGAQIISTILAAILAALVQTWIMGAGAAPSLAFLAAAGGGAAALAAPLAGALALAAAIAVFVYVATMIHMAMLDMNMVTSSDAPDCECYPDPKPPECECFVEPRPRSQSDRVHNACADYNNSMGENENRGFDTYVEPPGEEGRQFDAISAGGSILWEVKTRRYSKYCEDLKKKRR